MNSLERSGGGLARKAKTHSLALGVGVGIGILFTHTIILLIVLAAVLGVGYLGIRAISS